MSWTEITRQNADRYGFSFSGGVEKAWIDPEADLIIEVKEVMGEWSVWTQRGFAPPNRVWSGTSKRRAMDEASKLRRHLG